MSRLTEAAPWSSLHVHLVGGQAVEDRCLVDIVAPALRATGQPWFYVRYWEGGPHLRVRTRAATDELRDRLGAFATTAGGRVVDVPYVPETPRYGGPAGLVCSEAFFHDSSELATELVARTPDAGTRVGLALDLLTAFASAVTPSALDAVRLLRFYAAGLAHVGEGPPVDVAALARAAEAEYLDRGDDLRRRFARQLDQLPPTTPSTSLVARWFGRVRALNDSYAALAAAGELVGDPQHILMSQLHMFHNRLGVSLPEEAYLAFLAALLLAGAHAPDDFRADGRDAADRRYHEHSKMYAARPWEVGWPTSSTTPRWAGHAATQPRTRLPDPDEARLAEARLGSVLRARRSAYGRYDAPVDLADLGTLLGYAAGTSRISRIPLSDGPGPLVALRTYPSGGARYPVRLAVIARAVEELPPAVYAYLADEHALVPVAPRPADVDLVRSSPMFEPTERSAIDVTAAPVVLCLIGELTYQREKYGIRAYRLLLLEAGHLAENLALVATAMDLATVPLASFYDDATNRLVLADGVHDSVLYVLPLARRTEAVTTAPDVAAG